MQTWKRVGFLTIILFLAGYSQAQVNPYVHWTLLPGDQMDEIIGEASGETAWNTIMETGGYNKDRLADEYQGTFYEAQYIYDQLLRYGLPGAEIVRFPGREVWDGIKGELWEVSPMRQKLASYRDMTAMLASGSENADVSAELVWVGMGTEKELKEADVGGKIVVTEGRMYSVHNLACQKDSALGVIAISQSRPHFDPIQIPWSGISGWRRSSGKNRFGFYITARDGQYLKRRLLRGESITVHAQVQSKREPYDLENVICHIPGSDPNAGEVIFSAHLFEGYVKQGANDNKSGSAAILETARVLYTLIEEERLPRPKRTIRFLWGPEFSGTGPWVKANQDIMEKTLCNINMDMVGEWLSKNQAFFCLMRTNYGHAHYINDIMENYYRFVGETSVERIHNRGIYPTPRRIVAPSGADEPFYYNIETHFGASDHEVFNDWGVGVPGVMMIAWPDQWYHTSGDRVDKADPTQLKRVVVIGAAGAYTVANADDAMALQILGEIAANATRRMGQQFILAQEKLNQSEKPDLADAYKKASNIITCAADAERATLSSVLELAQNRQRVSGYISQMQKVVNSIEKAHLKAIQAHMVQTAKKWNTAPVKIRLTSLEKKAAKIVPSPTNKVRANGYRGYSESIRELSEEIQKKYPYDRRKIASTAELQRLINGKNSALDIQYNLDAQYQRETDLQNVLNYLEILKAAGLVVY